MTTHNLTKNAEEMLHHAAVRGANGLQVAGIPGEKVVKELLALGLVRADPNRAQPPAYSTRIYAVGLGHEFEHDPPAVMSSMRRETCSKCGRARLIRRDGTSYGSATERDCVEALIEEVV